MIYGGTALPKFLANAASSWLFKGPKLEYILDLSIECKNGSTTEKEGNVGVKSFIVFFAVKNKTPQDGQIISQTF